MITKRRDHDDADRILGLLPLRPAAFAILAALADGPAAGFEVLERANQAVPGRPILGPGTLYRLMRELRQDGWIERTDAPDSAASDDERRSYHTLTTRGRAILVAEAERLRRTMAAAGLLTDGAQS